jgi:cytochrome c-type biogenesis protein CcsB
MIMESFQFLNITTFAYLASSILYLAILIYGGRTLGRVATLVTIGGLVINTIGIGLRWYEAYKLDFGYYAPFSNMYESLVFMAWCTALFYLVIERIYKNQTLGAFSMPLAFLAMAMAEYWPQWNSDLRPLVPALQSNWLIIHVIAYFIGYAALGVACGIAVMYLLKHRSERLGHKSSFMATLPTLKILDDLIYKSILFGFVLFTAGTTTGAVWANSAWGTYWSWDPKETWSIITWFVYAGTIHAKFTKGWGGQRIAWLAIFGFVCVIFTYYGVNFLLSGLHSYG